MIEVVFYRNKANQYTGFNCIGHAGYADAGEDIICAAVSALVINTINSIENLTKDEFELVTNEEEGLISVSFPQIPKEDTQLLLASLALGLQEIQKNNGNKYIHFIFEEV